MSAPVSSIDCDSVVDSIASLMDFTLLDHNATEETLQQFCAKANIARPAAICVFSEHVVLVKGWLQEGIRVTAVCGGFPVGSSDSSEVVEAINIAASCGVDEIDIVLEPKDALDFPGAQERDLLVACRAACGPLVLKVIIETPMLNEDQTRAACQIALSSGADFIKSCTGKRGGCSLDAVRVMSSELKKFEESSGEKRGIKISGGIQTKDQALNLLSIIAESYPEILTSPGTQFSRADGGRVRIGASSLLKDCCLTSTRSRQGVPRALVAGPLSTERTVDSLLDSWNADSSKTHNWTLAKPCCFFRTVHRTSCLIL